MPPYPDDLGIPALGLQQLHQIELPLALQRTHKHPDIEKIQRQPRSQFGLDVLVVHEEVVVGRGHASSSLNLKWRRLRLAQQTSPSPGPRA